MIRVTVTTFIAVALAACGITESTTFGEVGDSLSTCEQAFADAAAEDEMHDSVEDMFPAVRTCGSLEEWDEAWDQFGDELAFQGTSRSVLTNMCFSDEIASEPLCQAVNE